MKKNMLLIISCISFFIINMPASVTGILYTLLFAIISIVFIIKYRDIFNYDCRNTFMNIISLLVCILFIFLFYRRWIPSSLVIKIASVVHINNNTFLIILSCVGFLLSYYFVSQIIYLIDSNFSYKMKNYKTNIKDSSLSYKISIKQKIFILFIAFITITVFSKSSFLYPLNDWVDANCFFTVGKSILSGKIPYLHLMEQKGPLLYFIHTLAAIISYDSFIGVYIIEIIACYFFLYYSYKILLTLTDKYIIYLLPFITFLIYSSTSFCHGDSAEELCMPFITYGLYLGLKLLKDKEFLSKKDAILLGITSGCVLWIKYTMLGFYIGWIIIPLILVIKNKSVVKFLKMILHIAIGVIFISTPIIIYFIYNNALLDLLNTYFYNNMFLYNNSMSDQSILNLFINEIHGFGGGIINNIQYYIFIILGIYSLWKMDRQLYSMIFILFVFTAFFIYTGSLSYPYYTFIMSIFSIFGLIYIYILSGKLFKKYKMDKLKNLGKYGLVCVLCFLYCFTQSSNIYLLFENKNNMPQFKFKEIICSEENATLLNYGFLDGGFYTTCEIVPNYKYFCQLNIPLEEMYEEQNRCIDEGLVDFVVTRNKEINNSHYQLISKASYYFEGTMFDYYLYQLIE